MKHPAEAEPAIAAELFGPVRIELARQFTANLASFGEERGLIGPLELERLWTRHIINCALPAGLVQAGGRVIDVGSGAGLPGIVLAIARPDAEFQLVEPMERRVVWLEEQVAELGLENVQVLRARAEDAPDGMADQVTARAVSALRTLIPITAPLLRPGGELILMKGAAAAREITAAEKVIRRFHLRDVEIIELGAELDTETTRVVRAIRD